MPFLSTFLLDTLKLDGQEKVTKVLSQMDLPELTNVKRAKLTDREKNTPYDECENIIKEMRK